jgi:hypothetical protein
MPTRRAVVSYSFTVTYAIADGGWGASSGRNGRVLREQGAAPQPERRLREIAGDGFYLWLSV